MSWKTAVTVLIIIFLVALIQSALAGPVVDIQTEFNESGDYSNDHFDGNERITSYASSWFDMGLILMFGMMTWGLARVARRELTRRRRR